MKNMKITDWYAGFLKSQIKEGDLCIDGTMGNGNDTLLLSRLSGDSGRVLAFDIQKLALEHTEELLKKNNAPENTRLILDSHVHIGNYASPDSVSCIVFNFGYLPGGDHALSTKAEISIAAMEEALKLLKVEGLLSLCIYSGGDSGFEERDAILSWLRELDPRKYLVIYSEFYNRPNNPPIPVLVIRIR